MSVAAPAGGPPAAGRPRIALRRAGLAAVGVFFLLAALGVAVAYVRHRLIADLPAVSGTLSVAGLAAPVQIARDALGVPTLRGADRRDVAFATGFVHAQDRFFQMDLLRRRAAGELAELFGAPALRLDKAMRIHLFREHAQRVLAASPPDVRGVLDAYTAGVNAGLGALQAPPFEYLVLRVNPRPWRGEDSVLVLFTMFAQLADVNAANESALSLMRDRLPPELYRFLVPEATEWEAPLAGTPPPAAPPPGPQAFDLRREPRTAAGGARGVGGASAGVGAGGLAVAAGPAGEDVAAAAAAAAPMASNSWAVAGRLTADGGALLADELHLGLAVPNAWYRAVLTWPAEGGVAAGVAPHRIAGVTLPGTPLMVAGSNGLVAWGVTNSALDTSDLVLLDLDPAHPDRYLTPQGSLPFEHHSEHLQVKGGAGSALPVDWTIWGPVLDQDWRGRKRAVRAVVDQPDGADFSILRLETAADLGQALDVAAASGVPALNFVAADRQGHIGWTIAGRLPRRAGFDGETAGPWADGARRWEGLLPPAAVPRVVDPPAGLLWTANNRVLAGEAGAPLGRGGYVLGARARQIRDDLQALAHPTADDMRRIQLDDRAVFLARWHDLLLTVLTPRAVAADSRRGEMRQLVEHWSGRADVGSAGYRMVRTFRTMVGRAVFAPLTAACLAVNPDFRYTESFNQYEGPLWQLVTRRPLNLLQPKYASWDEQLLAAADQAIELLVSKGPRLADRTWGERNTLAMEHPMSEALPIVGRHLSMPPRPLPGDDEMPRVQGPSFGATVRMVVSPGHEDQAILEMPGGESGNPISPHYHDLLDSWAEGAPAPLLPGKTVTVLNLVPAGPATAAPAAAQPTPPR